MEVDPRDASPPRLFQHVGEEAPLPFLCESEVLARNRNFFLGKGLPTELDVRQMKLQTVVTFFKKLDQDDI